MCGLVGSRGGRAPQVVVTGGFDVWDASTEVLHVNDVNAGWERGPKLPLPLREAATVQYKV